MKPDGSEEWTLFGIGGEKIGTFTTSGPVVLSGSSTQTASFVAVKVNVWFDGRLVTEGGVPVYSDRLGTNRASGARFRPYGDEITSTSNDRVKFGTYTRDSFSGLDYADQRFYASTYGRFNTADPYRASAGVADPGSWNRYSYVSGDPVHFNDPRGELACWVGGTTLGDGIATRIQCIGDGPSVGVFYRDIQISGMTAANYQDALVQAQEDLAAYDSGPLATVRQGLRSIAQMSLNKCRGVLESIAGVPLANIQTTARYMAGFVYEGTNSSAGWTTDLGGTTSGTIPSGWTVGDEFAASPETSMVAQSGGYALYVRGSDFAGIPAKAILAALGGFWSVDASGALNTFGSASLLHEVLHKFGKSDHDLKQALGISDSDYLKYATSSISKALQTKCW